ncbi:hypothetical protein A2415_02480 [candidate division WWE3 bacterium RIFOXYC1_FULL_39_7]|uniref:Uncharacterized protein n=2 Tax=Katanobacteria TaxID=422282 RepID=A0A1F4X3B2_UNCKA|nr:MAG: hypothetical protein A2415_02480 [candidate division WWE3 bacterium RIFOXYC1_FULL_39_7]OGC76167.1 MAG: hypothetical protein A2619_05625 [candidate division WWE3 bacterium RIFOXYD1_FULL_39_9]
MKNFILSTAGAFFMMFLALTDFVAQIATASMTGHYLGNVLEAHVVHVLLGLTILVFAHGIKKDAEMWADTINFTFEFWSKSLLYSMILGVGYALYVIKGEELAYVISAGALFGVYALFPTIVAMKALIIILHRPY